MARLDNNSSQFEVGVNGDSNHSSSAIVSAQSETNLATEVNRKTLFNGAESPDRRPILPRQILSEPQPFGQLVFSDPVRTFSDEELRALQLPPRPALPDFMQAAPGSAQSYEQLCQAHAQLVARAATLEKSLSECANRLAESTKTTETICSALAVDFREPLRGFSRLLRAENIAALSDGRDYERLRSAAERLDRLTDGLLSYIQLSREEVACETVSLETIVSEIVETLGGRRDEIHCQGQLAQVHAHPFLVRQVFTHLVDNALKFVPPKTAPEVKIWSEANADMVRVYIEDNGIGIAPEHHERIFGMFQRLSNAYPGTGIGLALVRKAVERMGGLAGVVPMPSKGSRFWIALQKPQ